MIPLGNLAVLQPGLLKQNKVSLRQVATRTYWNNCRNLTLGATVAFRSTHRLRTGVSPTNPISVVYSNVSTLTGASSPTGSGTESVPGNSLTYSLSIEYPIGTVIGSFTFGGSATGTLVQAVAARITTDPLGVTIPEGALFGISGTIVVGSQGAGGCPYVELPTSGATNTLRDVAAGDFMTVNGTPQTYSMVFPLAILANSAKPAVWLCGDSICQGVNGTTSSNGDTGILSGSIGPTTAYINAGVASDRLSYIASNNTNRVAAAKAYCTHVISELGIIDISLGNSYATITTNMATLISAFAPLPVYLTTYTPNTTSTDSWATIANQSLKTGEAVRTQLNDNIVGTPGFQSSLGFFATGRQLENSLNGGRWKVNGTPNFYTRDGVHGEQAAYDLVRDSGVLNPGIFNQP